MGESAPDGVQRLMDAARRTEECWERISAGNGAKGPRVYDWAWVPLHRRPEPEWGHWLLVRRSSAGRIGDAVTRRGPDGATIGGVWPWFAPKCGCSIRTRS